MNRITEWCDNALDWMFDRFLSGCLMLFIIGFVALCLGVGIKLYRDSKEPFSARVVQSKSESQIYVLVGKVMVPMPSYQLRAADGSVCTVDQLTYETRKLGETQVCQWK